MYNKENGYLFVSSVCFCRKWNAENATDESFESEMINSWPEKLGWRVSVCLFRKQVSRKFVTSINLSENHFAVGIWT